MLEWVETYRILLTGLFTWWLAQFLKVPFEYMVTRHWNWALWFSTGGMPSSHSALVTGMSMSVGLWAGFETPSFAVSVALAMIVVYDAAGVRRQAGLHAQRLNLMINELFSGQPISEIRLKEVLGHTPRQVLGGVLLGIIVPSVIYMIWH